MSVLDTLFLASVRFCIHVFSAGRRLQQEAVMPILLWYLPFAVFSGACDLLFAEPEVQVNEPADLDHAVGHGLRGWAFRHRALPRNAVPAGH